MMVGTRYLGSWRETSSIAGQTRIHMPVNAPIAFMAVLLAVLAGCASNVRGYPGPARAASELATLWLPELELEAIDGIAVPPKSSFLGPAKADVLPGTHRIAVIASLGHIRRHVNDQAFEVEVMVEARHVYYLFAYPHGLRYRLAVKDMGTDFAPPRPTIFGGADYRRALEAAKTAGVAQ